MLELAHCYLLSDVNSVQGEALLLLPQWPTCRWARMIASGSWKITRLSISAPRSRLLALPSPLQNNQPLAGHRTCHLHLFISTSLNADW